MATDPLQPLAQDIWLADGPEIGFYGIPFPTRMTVIRLASGELVLHSPVARTPDVVATLAALGPVRHLVAPNWIHYAWIGEWADAEPEATTWAAPGVRARAESRGVRIRWDRDLEDAAPDAWAEDIDQIIVRGSRWHSEAVFFHRASRTLILTDLIENMRAQDLPFWIRPLARLGGVLAPNGRMPLDIFLSFTGHRDRLRRALGRMLDWEPRTIVLAHGDIFRENAARRLRQGFRNLRPLGAGE